MGRFRARIDISATMTAALLATHTLGETASVEPAVESEPVGAEASAEGVPAKTVSAVLPGKNEPLFRHQSYPDAWTAAQKSNRPILLYVTTPGCTHCEKMMAETYHLPSMEQMISRSFETVYVSGRTNAKLVKSLKIKWYPTTVLVGANNKIVDVIEGYVDAKTFRSRLQTGLASVDSSTQTR